MFICLKYAKLHQRRPWLTPRQYWCPDSTTVLTCLSASGAHWGRKANTPPQLHHFKTWDHWNVAKEGDLAAITMLCWIQMFDTTYKPQSIWGPYWIVTKSCCRNFFQWVNSSRKRDLSLLPDTNFLSPLDYRNKTIWIQDTLNPCRHVEQTLKSTLCVKRLRYWFLVDKAS